MTTHPWLQTQLEWEDHLTHLRKEAGIDVGDDDGGHLGGLEAISSGSDPWLPPDPGWPWPGAR